jgi:hypothetical protein
MSQVLQWVGAVLVLVAFALSQWGMWSVRSYRYLTCNFFGGGGLAAAAVLTRQWGFLLLEGVWALVAGRGILVRLSHRDAAPPPASTS